MDENGRLHQDLGRIEGKLDAMAGQVATLTTLHDNRLNAHSDRLRKVENRQSWFLGIGAAAATVVTALWHWIKEGISS